MCARVCGCSALCWQWDIFFRSLQLAEMAAQQFENYSRDLKQILVAYSNGVNDGAASLRMKPIQFKMMGIKFEPWTPIDTILTLDLMSLLMASDYQLEPLRTQLAAVFGKELAAELLPAKNSALFEDNVIMNDEELKHMGLFQQNKMQSNQKLYQRSNYSSFHGTSAYLTEEFKKFTFLSGSQGSNSWVISGNYTSTGTCPPAAPPWKFGPAPLAPAPTGPHSRQLTLPRANRPSPD